MALRFVDLDVDESERITLQVGRTDWVTACKLKPAQEHESPRVPQNLPGFVEICI